ncbi:copper amine oxidase N-terminal domain-containing protein [Paenibacillus profundus]|uniref:Copper amine oxidase N-terminal domain-containing protein n=1 Tax=Paenibacillus profundus TaxID=1173085 RepID=A0ABS8YBJ9_9BACL|nr:stalk domain-containing protein [Paenibacillus profundus]MCE5169368.1 copper amine oxidase N-terminal domain-containing protein [Paenibacillus profundus]
MEPTTFREERPRQCIRSAIVALTLIAMVTGGVGLTASPVSAAAATAAIQDQLRFKTGSTNASLNGEAITIVKPYVKQGTTMVPLSIFTRAFDASLKLETGDVVTLTNDHSSIRMRIGQKQAMLNGKLTTLLVAPELVNGTTMVPLKQIAEAFGATCKTDSDQTMVLSWKRPEPLAAASIHVNATAPRIGDSYYLWSMVLPQGWSYEVTSPTESVVVLGNESSSVVAQVEVTDWNSGELEHLTSAFQGVATEKQLMEHLQTEVIYAGDLVYQRTGKLEGVAYAQGVSDGGDEMYLARVLSANGKRYVVRIFDDAAKQPKQLLQYEPFLNTFRPSYAAGQGMITNVSTVKDGYRHMKLWGEGLSVDFPVDWYKEYGIPRVLAGAGDWKSVEYYYGTAEQGMTPDGLVKRHEAYLKKLYKPEYVKLVETKDISLADGTLAKLNVYKHRYNEQDWSLSMHLIAMDEGVQYMVSFYGQDNAEDRKVGDRILASVRVDGKMKEKQDDLNALPSGENWLMSWEKSVQRDGKPFGFTVQIPEWWLHDANYYVMEGYEEKLDEGTIASYSLPNSNFFIYIEEARTVDEALARWEEVLLEDDAVHFVKKEKTTLQGKSAYLVELTGRDVDINAPYTTRMQLVADNGHVYTVLYTVYDASMTTELMDSLKQATKSFTFK